MPQGLARHVGRKLVRQADGQDSRDGHPTPDKGCGDRLRERIGIQCLTVEQHPQVGVNYLGR